MVTWRDLLRAGQFIGLIFSLVGITLLMIGVILGLLNILSTDDEGYVMSDPFEVRSDTDCYYLVFLPDGDINIDIEYRLAIEPKGGRDLFVGWMWFHDIGPLLTNRSYETPLEWSREYRFTSWRIDIPQGIPYNEGLSRPAPHGNESYWIWTRKVEGPTVIDVDIQWQPTNVKQVLVILNGDGSEGVSVDIAYGTRISLLIKAPLGMIPAGSLLLFLGAALIITTRIRTT